MPFVNKSGGDDEDEATSVASGAPPAIDFDPNDPDQVLVHYNLTGWSIDQRAELAETLAERTIPHVWDGDELVVPEAVETDVDTLFDELDEELGPFPVPLLDEAGTEFGLDEWSFADLEMLQQSLVEAEIPHRWEGRTLLVAEDAEHVVDDLLDAIEAGEVASIDEDAEAPDGALNDLYVAADRLARDHTDSSARSTVFELVPRLSPGVPPYGMAVRSWEGLVARARALHECFEEGTSADSISSAADELRTMARPYV